MAYRRMTVLAVTAWCALASAAAPSAHGATRRIVSLAPSITETLFALGAGPEVVGVSQYCDYPPAATRLTRVGSFLTPNVEVIAGLRPTLVIGPATSSNLRELVAVRAMGCPTLMIKDDTLADIQATILQIGARIGRGAQARELVDEIRRHIDAVRARLRDAKPRKLLMLVGHQPLVAVGQGTYLDELLTLAGGINIADRVGEAWPHLGVEYVVAMAPDVILDGEMGSDPATPATFWAQFPSIPAVRARRVYGYPTDLVLHPGPRVWQTLDLMAALIHPEIFGSPRATLARLGAAH